MRPPPLLIPPTLLELTALSPSRARVRGTIAAAVVQPEDLRQLRFFHKVMADVNRLRIVRSLAGGDATVAELTAHVGLSQPLVSRNDVPRAFHTAADEVGNPLAAVVGEAGEGRIAEDGERRSQIEDCRLQICRIARQRVSQLHANSSRPPKIKAGFRQFDCDVQLGGEAGGGDDFEAQEPRQQAAGNEIAPVF